MVVLARSVSGKKLVPSTFQAVHKLLNHQAWCVCVFVCVCAAMHT